MEVCKVQQNTTLWPGDYLEVDVPPELNRGALIAVEPRTDIKPAVRDKYASVWLEPRMTDVVAGKIRLLYTSSEPGIIRRNEHFCQARNEMK